MRFMVVRHVLHASSILETTSKKEGEEQSNPMYAERRSTFHFGKSGAFGAMESGAYMKDYRFDEINFPVMKRTEEVKD
jgi:hypothetical protein